MENSVSNRAWVGTDYGAPTNVFGGLRVLVLGESIHSTEHVPGTILPDYNNQLIGEYLERAPADGADQPLRWLRTFDNMAWALSGDGPDASRTSERRTWQSVAFYNYVDSIVGDSSRKRPPRSAFRNAAGGFESALEQAKPHLVVCWGLELFGWVINNHFKEYSKPWDFQGEWIDLPRSRPIRIVRMQHPSTAFSPKHWHVVISNAIHDYIERVQNMVPRPEG